MKNILFICSFLLISVYSSGQSVESESFLLMYKSFEDYGSWKTETQPEGFIALTGNNTYRKRESKPAKANIEIVKAGAYKIWVFDRDYEHEQGTRYFNVALNGKMLSNTFGQHGKNRFSWTDGGTFYLEEGKNLIELFDTSGYYARFGGLFITDNKQFVPPSDIKVLAQSIPPIDLLKGFENLTFPDWATKEGTFKKSVELQNEHIKINFTEVTDNKKRTYVQNEIFVKNGNNWIKVKDKTEGFGYLMLKAKESNKADWVDGTMLYNQVIDYKGNFVPSMTANIYRTGLQYWIIPSSIEKVSENKVKLLVEDIAGTEIDIVWELPTGQTDPKVTFYSKFNENGAFSFVFSSGREFKDDEYENALIPFRIMERRVPKESFTILEHFLFTPMASITLPEGNSIASRHKLTSAIVVDPEWLPRGYVYRETSKFGIGLRGPEGGLQGNITAPLFGSDYCTFKRGETYDVSFRLVYRLSSWFDTYKHIAQGIFNVHDYRSNYYTSLNEAIYNTTELMLDNDYGGWDPVDKAHYNMEEKDLTSVANPITAVQRYLLTENEKLLDERVVPTMANMLTRMRLHFKRRDSKGGANYLSGVEKPAPIGSPIKGYNLNVFGGLYEMSRGMTPGLYSEGLNKIEKVTNQYGNTPQFSNDISLFRYTGDSLYLASAKKKADKYLDEVVYGEKYNTELADFRSFINIQYFPNLASLLDIYQVTHEKRYLDAAIKTGQMLSTSLWVPGIDGDKWTTPYRIIPSETHERPFMDHHQFWWHGSQQWRLGNDDGEAKPSKEGKVPLKEEVVPGWLPARVGLGLEQGSTFGEALYIYMNTWAGDMMKLSALSGEKYFETVAKNAIIGRFGNYSGYYQNRYITHQIKPDYPYVGPDLTGIYWHHIPPFLAMLEDFLINQIWAKSNKQIEFPSVRQQGYAYFNSNHYGFEAGRFYDQKDMWLWNDRGIIEPDSKQINYLVAKKDGLFGVALLNEGFEDEKTTITLGNKLGEGRFFSGDGIVYDEDGTKHKLKIERGKFNIDIPAKGMRSVVIPISQLRAPGYAQIKYELANVDSAHTIAEHERGKAYVLQFSPDKYAAYIYITDLPKDTQSISVNYKKGNETNSISVNEYPFEVIINVNDVDKELTYDIDVFKTDGSTENIKGGILKSILHK